ncbi:hypothetical protein ACFCV3_00515 [Kribbella sp. NPDC056345]|uniref:hypothetical protein n=1 Tax=Kribbella sp. NPDC056345 TaxID=3345789 RepID=UPI0035DFCEC2
MIGPAHALRGDKCRRLAQALTEGLHRPSAAWFSAPPGEQITLATAAAAVFLALGPKGRAQLLQTPGQGQFTKAFMLDPGLLPVLLAFTDERTGNEVWHRYRWQRSDGDHLTAEYTKVERAQRSVSLTARSCTTARASVDDVNAIERELPLDAGRHWWEQPELVRSTDRPASSSVAASATRIGTFCESIGSLLLARLTFESVGRTER